MPSATISIQDQKKLLATLQKRFESNPVRHQDIKWDDVRQKLEDSPSKISSLYHMEITGGEPDVIGKDKKTNKYLFVDCSAQTPKGRCSICYDREALDKRKANKPNNTALDMAEEMGIKILEEVEYKHLQTLGNFDTTTGSWIQTPQDIRELGGALFAHRRYNSVFIFHNGADSYYAGRGFRGILKV